MTEQEIQPDDTNQNQDLESSSFWSPWAIFFFGVNYAALNWWRMGKKRKAIVFFVIFILLGFVYDWFNVRNSSWVDLELKQTVLLTNLIVSLILQILLAVIVWRDQRKFEQSGETPFPTRWTIILKFFAVMLIFAGLRYCLYNLPTVFGDCGVPRFQDVVYQAKLTNRSGLEKLFLSRKDFDCNLWSWSSEGIETESSAEKSLKTENISGVLQTTVYDLHGRYGKSAEWTDFMGINQTVFVLAQPVTRERFALLVDDYNNPTLWSVPDTSKYDLRGIWIESRCRDFEDLGNRCVIYLADHSMVVKLSFIWNGDINMNELIKQATEKTAYRMYQYNQSP